MRRGAARFTASTAGGGWGTRLSLCSFSFQPGQENTYSNLISTAFPPANLLSLNFGYHNAHHTQPMTPWRAPPPRPAPPHLAAPCARTRM